METNSSQELFHFVRVCSLEGILKQQLWRHLMGRSVAGLPNLGRTCAQEPGSVSPTPQDVLMKQDSKARSVSTVTAGMTLPSATLQK